jgi:integrase
MARRRHQKPKPFIEGNFWYLRVWDAGLEGNRKRKRIRLAPATMAVRQAQKIADEKLEHVNGALITATSAINFNVFVQNEYKPDMLPTLSKTTQNSYKGMVAKHLAPHFGRLCLRELTPAAVQHYFSSLAGKVAHPTILKLRDALSSIVRHAIVREFLVKNPLDNLRLPKDNRPRRRKAVITVEQFHQLLQLIAEPYASMVFVATLTGLRVSELLALRWGCVDTQLNTIRVEERFTRGDWSQPKTSASAAPISVDAAVIERLEHLKTLEVSVRAGLAMRHYQVVKSARPSDLVFQSLQSGVALNDQNILKRHLQPAARQLGFHVTWHCLRRSYATWLVQAGSDVKAAQSLLRHSRVETTLNVYAQAVSAAQRQAVAKLAAFVGTHGPITGPQLVQ